MRRVHVTLGHTCHYMFPGYKHVQTFAQDEEYEEEVEVQYVTLDLGSNVDKALLPNTSECRLIGLDTPTPMLQLSGTFFKGAHEQLIGTEIIFTDGRDDANISKKFVVPVATTEQRIKFEQVEVKDKGPEPQEEETEEDHGSKPQEKPREYPRGRGKGKPRGRPRQRGRGQPVGLLQHEYGETVMDLDTS